MEEKKHQSRNILPADYLTILYRQHFQGALVRSGASMIMWLFALAAYHANIIRLNQFTGISLSILYLILINPPTLLLLKRVTHVLLYRYVSLLINFLEIIGYTAIIYFLGGIEATFLTPIYAALITYVGVVAPRSFPYIIAFLCSAVFSFVIVSEHFGLLPHQTVDPSFDPPLMIRLTYLSVVIGLLLIVAYVSSLTAGTLKKNRNKLLEQNKELQAEITERKRAEEDLHKSEERYGTILEDMDEGYFEIDLAGNFTFVNDAECRDLGYSREELIGMNYRQYSDEATAKKSYELYSNIYKTGKPIKRISGKYISKDGTRHFNEVSASLIRDAKGKPIGFRGISQDVTDRRRAEEELQRAHDELEQRVADRTEELRQVNEKLQAEITERKQAEEKIKASLLEKEMMLKEIHHRVKNNLTVISSLLDLQSSHLQDERAREALQESMARVRTMAMIHTQLYQSQNLARVDFGLFIRDLISNISQSYGRTESPVEIHVDADETNFGIDTSIPCGLILNELVTNAMKHAFPQGKEGKINIRMRSKESRVMLTVQDNGIGCPESIDLTNLKSLGLELVNVLVGQINGQIDMQVEHGTTWTITFPVKNEREWQNG